MLGEFVKHKTGILTIIENVAALIKEDTETAYDRLLMTREQLRRLEIHAELQPPYPLF